MLSYVIWPPSAHSRISASGYLLSKQQSSLWKTDFHIVPKPEISPAGLEFDKRLYRIVPDMFVILTEIDSFSIAKGHLIRHCAEKRVNHESVLLSWHSPQDEIISTLKQNRTSPKTSSGWWIFVFGFDFDVTLVCGIDWPSAFPSACGLWQAPSKLHRPFLQRAPWQAAPRSPAHRQYSRLGLTL